MAKIRKHALIVVSAGRTGTAFLGRHLSTFVSDCWSTHEPDVWDGSRSSHSWRAVRWFGVYHTVVGKVLRRTGMRAVSERYMAREWSEAKAAAAIVRQRKRFYESRPATLVAESNYQWYGVLPLLGRVFDSYRVLAVTRDPRTWLRSRINFGAHHDVRDRVARFGLPRVSPGMVGDEPPAREWAGMDTFQRLCWDWNHVTARLLDAAANDPAVVLARFEDLFLAADRKENMTAALRAATTFPNSEFRVEVPANVLGHRTNISTPGRTRGWEDWTEAQRSHLLRTCGATMGRLGYEV